MSFVPTQFSSLTNNFDFDMLNTETPSNFVSSNLKNMKKADDFFDISRMSKPSGIINLQQRVSYNISYFAPNYIAIIGLFFLYCIFTNIPFFLFLFAEIGIIYVVQTRYGHSDEIDMKVFTLHRNIWYTILLVVNVPVFFIWSPLSSVFWLSLLSGSIILAHASIMDKPIEATYSAAV